MIGSLKWFLKVRADEGLHSVEALKAAVIYAKSRVHESFKDPLIDECIFTIAREKEKVCGQPQRRKADVYSASYRQQ